MAAGKLNGAPMTDTLPPGLADHPRIDQWLSFAEDGVVRLRSGKVEYGQGIATALVQIAAEELDVDPAQINLVAGDTRECPDEGMTAGSRSIEAGGIAVRYAASAARHVLLAEAAKLLQSTPDKLKVIDGLVHAGDRPTDLTYWSLAKSVDLGAGVAEHARPKPVAERRLVGRSLPRIDLPAKVKGPAFIQDLVLPDMLHGRVLHPPSRDARLTAVDVDALAALPGVVKVVRDGSFLGVIAETEWAALNALARAEASATWEHRALPPDDVVAAVKATTAEPDVGFSSGDPSKLEGRRFETQISRPLIAHASIATCCGIAHWDDGRLTLYGHTQDVNRLRRILAQVFELDLDNIQVIYALGAGVYGHNGADEAAYEAALLARAAQGRPVRLVWSRADELSAGPLGPAMATRMQAVVDGGNRIQGLTVEVRSMPFGGRPGAQGEVNLLAASRLENGPPQWRGWDSPFKTGGGADRNAVPSYTIPAVHLSKQVVFDVPVKSSALRGLGAFINVVTAETLMDDIAHGLGVDPVALRLEHLEDERARTVIERAAEMAGWPGESGDGVGLGLGFARYKNQGAYCAVVARVEVDEAVRVTHVWTCVDAGAVVNPDGVANQIEGGIIQGASWTLKEAVRIEDGVIVTRDWETYPILRFSEVPEVAVEIVDRPNEKEFGVGEVSMGPAGGAIGNAVFRALGVRVRDLPLTRDAIMAALV